MKNIYQKTKDTLKCVLATYIVVGGIYGCAMHNTGQTTGHVSMDVAQGKNQPHAELWRMVFGKTLEDVIMNAVEND